MKPENLPYLDCPKAKKKKIFFCINVNVWVSGKVKSKPQKEKKKKVFELQEHK